MIYRGLSGRGLSGEGVTLSIKFSGSEHEQDHVSAAPLRAIILPWVESRDPAELADLSVDLDNAAQIDSASFL